MFPGESHESLPTGYVIADRYHIVRALGSGGMASVYLAEDVVLGETKVAIKVLRGGAKGREEMVSRFLREVRLTHKINHENVVRTFDFGQDGDTLFYTMEHLEGRTLEQLIRTEKLPLTSIISILHQLLRGITAIHSVGVIHRDLKPANIIVLEGGRLKITDFGIARGGASSMTQASGDIVGTMAYVAPETLMGEEPTVAVDYYSLAVIVYQLLTGSLPIDDPIPARLIMRKVEESPPDPRELNPELPEWLSHGLLGLLEPEAKLRMKSLPQFVRNLEQNAPYTDRASILNSIAADTISLKEMMGDTPLKRRTFRAMPHGALLARIASSLAIGLLAFLAVRTGVTSRFDYTVVDQLFKVRGPISPDPRVMIVAMDERSYDALSVPITSPWPRSLHTKLLTRLAEGGAAKVVMDILFVDASVDPKYDQVLASAISKVPTILGAASAFGQHATINGSFFLEELISPLPVLTEKAAGIGLVGIPQTFGRARHFLVERSELFPDIASLAEMAAAPETNEKPVSGPEVRDLINYYGPTRTIPTVSYEMAVSDKHPLPDDTFEGKIVFVGLGLRGRTGPSQREAFVTPYDEATFGTEIHATATSNRLQEEWIARPSLLVDGLSAAAAATVCALTILLLSGWAAAGALTFVVGLILSWQYILFIGGWYLPLTIGALLGSAIALATRALAPQKRYSKYRRKFG